MSEAQESAAPGRLASFWEEEAERYDRAYDTRGGRGLRARQAAVMGLLGDQQPGDVLDAGMGPGRLLSDLDARGWRVAGVDISAAMVDVATSRLPHAAPRLRQGSIEQLPFPADSFDAVVATGVLEYVEFRGGALRELARTLRSGGIAVVSVPNRLSPRELASWALVYPVTRCVKRVATFGRPAPPRRPLPPGSRRFRRALAEVGLDPVGCASVGPAVAGPLRRLLARQLVFAARKRSPAGR